MAKSHATLLYKLLSRGDSLSIKNGRLVVTPKSGKALPSGWLDKHSEPLCCEILKAIGLDAYRYESYSTGSYGERKSQGVTLQFVSIIQGQEAYCIFNADLKRLRGAQKGSSLPKSQFRVGKRSNFYKFWLKTGLKLPDRLCHFHNYMGNLRQLILTSDGGSERLSAGTLRPLNLDTSNIKQLVLPPIKHPTATQHTPNIHPTMPPKESPEPHQPSGIQPDQTTGVSNCGNTVIRNTGTREKVYPLNTSSNTAQTQSVDEWLSDYGE